MTATREPEYGTDAYMERIAELLQTPLNGDPSGAFLSFDADSPSQACIIIGDANDRLSFDMYDAYGYSLYSGAIKGSNPTEHAIAIIDLLEAHPHLCPDVHTLAKLYAIREHLKNNQ